MKKALKFATLFGAILVILVASAGMAARKPVPEYVGSDVCLGCHADRWSSWAGSVHASMVSPIMSPEDIPGYDVATEEQKAELLKADYVVSGGRFLARDNATGSLVFLKYEWNHDEEYWFDYDDAGVVWQDRCMGCHVTQMPKVGTANTPDPDKFGIGCESCHGPGREHIASKGDPSKIVLNPSSDVCGQCHNSGYKAADGNRWIYGHDPAIQLADDPTVVLPAPLNPELTPNLGHHKTHNEWMVSGHGPKAVADLQSSDHASDRCYTCHTQEGYSAAQHGETFEYIEGMELQAISCVTCHRPHGLGLAEEEDQLCASCHNGSIPEGGSVKPGSTPHHPMKEFFQGWGAAGGLVSAGNVHSDVTCQECHMRNNNHLMHIIRPDDPNIAANSEDSCAACHEESTREARAGYLNMWQDTTSSKIDALNATIAQIDAAVKAGQTLTADQKLMLDTARTNIAYIVADGSMGAHNFDYAMTILSAAQKDLNTVKAAVVR